MLDYQFFYFWTIAFDIGIPASTLAPAPNKNSKSSPFISIIIYIYKNHGLLFDIAPSSYPDMFSKASVYFAIICE